MVVAEEVGRAPREDPYCRGDVECPRYHRGIVTSLAVATCLRFEEIRCADWFSGLDFCAGISA